MELLVKKLLNASVVNGILRASYNETGFIKGAVR